MVAALLLAASTATAPTERPTERYREGVPPPQAVGERPTERPVRALDATELADRANKLLRGDSSHARIKMTVVTPRWERSLEIEGWNQGRQKALIVLRAPPKDRGNATLRRGGEMWLWLPRVEKVVKVPATMMHSSWQGSDFTYEDIAKADSVVRDYTHRIVSRGPAGEGEGERVSVEATPKPDAPVVWGRVLLRLRLTADGGVLPEREEDYNERGQLVRVIALSQPRVLGGRLVPTRLECRPERKPGQRTVIEYQDIDFGVELGDGFFSLERLQRAGGEAP